VTTRSARSGSSAGSVSDVLVRVLFLNLAVAAAKLVFGYATGTVSIISDGFHSLTDSASNVVGLAGARASRKPPDEDHPYGHRKFETLAAAAIFLFLVLVVVEVARAALNRLSAGGAPHVSGWSFGVMLVTMAINILVVRYERREGRRLASELLMADAVHTQSDVLTSCAVLVSLAGVYLGAPLLDPIGGLVIAGFIAYSGWQVARETSYVLADRAVMDESRIRGVVMSVPEVVGCHQIRTRGTSDHIFLDLHVWFSGDTTLFEAHRLSHVVKDRVLEAFPEIKDAIIHIEPPPAE
jgi:cation diffusion facilitator family transporter